MARKPSKSGSSYSYFKEILIANPQWLKGKTNAIILAKYKADHGLAADAELEKKVMNNLSNLKSVLRKKLRKRGRKPGSKNSVPAAAAKPSSKLEQLEISIDNCLTTARILDPEGLEEIINLLRRARNQVVWKLGE